MRAEAFLNSLVDYEKIPGYHYDLDAFRRFLDTAGVSYQKLKNVIHIAGTKGKGSVAAMVSACLTACGYRVGTFTSPHLVRINERITINGRQVSDRQLSALVRRLAPFLGHGRSARTFFEAVTATAFCHFIAHRVHFTVLEVGLGGRLDATNVTEPLISVITRIGYDHTHLLGNTLPEIAMEKAGILKPGGTLVTTQQRYSVQRVVQRAARAHGNRVIVADRQHCITVRRYSLQGMQLRISGRLGTFSASMPLVGQHQIENLLIALSVLAEIKDRGYSISTANIVQGLRHILLHGRFDLLATQPPVIFDCAHNEDSFRALHQNLKACGIRTFFMIFGSNYQKDFRYCITHLFPIAREVVLVRTHNPRAIEPHHILSLTGRRKNISIASSVRTALEYVKRKSSTSVPIIITGSFYLWQNTWSNEL